MAPASGFDALGCAGALRAFFIRLPEVTQRAIDALHRMQSKAAEPNAQ